MTVLPYRVILATKAGEMEVDLNSTQGPEAAGRRARFTLVHARRYGDIDQVSVIAVLRVCAYALGCDRLADGMITHPITGPLPCCAGCARVAGDNLTPLDAS